MVVQVNLVIAETFEEFFLHNDVDPNAVGDAFKALMPSDYAANYDPSKGAIVKQNRFVRNMAGEVKEEGEGTKVKEGRNV